MTLREQVARAMWETPSVDALLPWDGLDEQSRENERQLADAAIGVVLAAIATQIEALRVPDETPWRVLDEVLALLRGAGGAASASGRVVDTGGAGAP